MLYADWLLLLGQLAPDHSSTSTTGRRRPACRSAFFYFVGVVFGVSAGYPRSTTCSGSLRGAASEADLVAVRE